MNPCWKLLRRPPGIANSSLTGYPSELSSQPIDAYWTRMAPCHDHAPMAGE